MDEHQLEVLMDQEIETHHHDGEEPAQAMSKVSDAMPGFGSAAALVGSSSGFCSPTDRSAR